MNVYLGVGMLQDHPRFLRWLTNAAPNSAIQDYKVDRLIPKRDLFDLRIQVQDQKGKWDPWAFQIVAASSENNSPFHLGNWDLVYRDPFSDNQIHIAKALDDNTRTQISDTLDSLIVESTLFAYTPDRRGVVLYRTNDGRRFFGKLYRSGRSKRTFETAKHLRESGLSDFLAEPVAQIPELEMIIWQEASGSLLSQEYPTANYRRGLFLAGEVLRKLHDTSAVFRSDNATSDSMTLRGELLTARTYLDRINSLVEKQSNELEKCCDELGRYVNGLDAFEKKTLHGDFHDNQVIFTDSSAVLLDIDRYVYGDPAIDVGNFLAHIDFRIAFEEANDDPKPYAAAFLEGYGQVGEASFHRRIVLAHAISLLRNCCLYPLVPKRYRLLTLACQRTVERLVEMRRPDDLAPN